MNLTASAEDTGNVGLNSESGRSPGGVKGDPLQYSCQEHPIDRGAWWATVCGVAELDTTERTYSTVLSATIMLYISSSALIHLLSKCLYPFTNLPLLSLPLRGSTTESVIGLPVKNQLTKSIKAVHRGCILSLCFFKLCTEYIMRNTGLGEAQAGIKIARRNINNLRYADDTILMAEREELKSLLMKVKEENEKVDLKLNIEKTKIMVSGPITSWQIDGETVKTVTDFI